MTCGACQVREVAKEFTGGNVAFEWAPGAFLAMQQAAEVYLVDLFADAYVQACVRRIQTRARPDGSAVTQPTPPPLVCRWLNGPCA